ncbi:MAG: hypothetical protein C0417_04545, partial [Chlorobiaceae bacterium]|nr:hypothetical protein [Chlorobiaceae bacterium]
MKSWIERAISLLEKSLEPIPQELNQLDWKIDISQKDERFHHHISGFANTEGGGFLVFGIDRHGIVHGVNKNIIDNIIQKIGNIARDGLEPSVSIDHSLEEYRGKSVLFIYIAESRIKPVHMRGQPLEESYIRSAAQTRKIDKNELRRALISSQPIRFEEMTAYTSQSLTDILSRLDYIRVFDMLRFPVPKTDFGIAEFLISQKFLTRDNDRYNITNLGVLVSAKEIQSFLGKERKAVRVN